MDDTTTIKIADTYRVFTTSERHGDTLPYDLTRYSMADASCLTDEQIDSMRTVVVDRWCFSTTNQSGSSKHTIGCFRHGKDPFTTEVHDVDGWIVDSRIMATRIGLMIGVLARFQSCKPTPKMPVEGIDRCPCGSKYWDGVTCHSCGETYKPDAT